MYCKHCGMEISNDSKFCHNCGKSLIGSVDFTEKEPAKKKKRHFALGIFLFILGIFTFSGVFSESDTPQKVHTSNTPENSVIVETTSAPIYTIGDTLEMGNVFVTLNDVIEIEEFQYIKPADGNIFVICDFTIENNSDHEIGISSMMSFECYFDEYATTINIGAMVNYPGKQQLDGVVAPGKKISGIVGYEVPIDWAEMEIHYKQNIYSDKLFIFNYSK